MNISQIKLTEQTQELLALCKTAVAEIDSGRNTLISLDNLREKQKNGKVNKSHLKNTYNQAIDEGERQKAALQCALDKIAHIRQLEHDIRVSLGPRSFRRGVLMSVLQESAKTIPLWAGKPGEKFSSSIVWRDTCFTRHSRAAWRPRGRTCSGT
ncbi:hypothetical protein FGIG_05185 [Fasciola gigantica]|uniref:Uncharacterized protein n=1 Tax=Fasciola gigantica TaxID=46835 RepID=A0A504Y854_FASGI|nr:hypothetical protein FGIG_05185 [Fasciola gigantica]